MFPPLALGITAVVMLGPSDTVHADAHGHIFLLGVISAVMLLGMLVLTRAVLMSSATKTSNQQGYDWAVTGVPRVTSIRATRSR